MSFSEVGHTKGSVLLTLDRDGRARTEQVTAPVHRELAVLRGDLDDILDSREHDGAETSWVQSP